MMDSLVYLPLANNIPDSEVDRSVSQSFRCRDLELHPSANALGIVDVIDGSDQGLRKRAK